MVKVKQVPPSNSSTHNPPAGRQARLRLDQALLERGLAETRQKAQALILAGRVHVDGLVADKAGAQVKAESSIDIIGNKSIYVGRGGEKILPALTFFSINPDGVIAIDVGASTGGFTDCLLKEGAKFVYAVDVGHNQIDYSLRQDPRVCVMEGTNARYLDPKDFDPKPSLAVIDVSFISLRLVLPAVVSIMANPFTILALVKPQFELGREYIEKGGVVKREEDQLRAVELVTEFAAHLGLVTSSPYASPLKGRRKGNQEYFIRFQSPF